MAVGATMTTDAARLCAEEMAHTLGAAVIDHTASDGDRMMPVAGA